MNGEEMKQAFTQVDCYNILGDCKNECSLDPVLRNSDLLHLGHTRARIGSAKVSLWQLDIHKASGCYYSNLMGKVSKPTEFQ